MRPLKRRGAFFAIQAVALPLALVAAYVILKWDLWHTTAFGGLSVSAWPDLQERATALLWKFTPVYAFLIWLAVGGMAYGFVHRRDLISKASGLNFLLVLVGALFLPFTLIGIGLGLFLTAVGIRHRNWLPPLCSVIANVLALAGFCWYGWDCMVAFGD